MGKMILLNNSDLTNCRKNRGWSQEKLATLSGINVRTIRAIENEQYNINAVSLKIVFTLFRVMGYTILWTSTGVQIIDNKKDIS